MAENRHQLLITIGAALSGSFNSAVSGSTSKIKQLGSVIKNLEQQSAISGEALNKLKLRYNSLLGSINRQQEIISKRGFYKSQILEVVALGAALAAPIKSAMDFEKSLAGIKSVVDFKAPEDLEKLGDVLTDMSRKMPLTADELANIAAVGGRFGILPEKLAEFSGEVGKTAVAWGVPVEDMTVRVGNLMKVFGSSTDSLSEYYNAVNLLGNKTGATGNEISKAINASADGLANFKLSIPEIAALNSTIISFGEGAEQAGSAVSNMLQKLSRAPELGNSAQKALRSIGLSSVSLPKMIQQDPKKVLDKLFSGLEKLNPEKRGSALYSIFGRGAAGVIGKIINNLDLYRKNLALVADPKLYEGSRDGDYQIVLETTESKLKMLSNTLTSFMRAVGKSLLPVFGEIVDGINEIVSPVMKWMEKNKELTRTITTAIAGFIAFRIGLFAIGYASTFLFGGLNRLNIAFKGLRLALSLTKTVFSSFLKWPMLIAGVAWLIYENWDVVKAFLLKFWEPIKEKWDEFKKKMDELGVTDFITVSWQKTQEFFSGIWNEASPYFDQFKGKMDELGVTENITNAWTKTKEFFNTVWDVASPYFDDFVAKTKELGFTGAVIDAWTKVKKFFAELWDKLFPNFDEMIKPLTSAWERMKGVFGFGSSMAENAGLKLPTTQQLATSGARNQNNNFEITINANKGDNAEIIAGKVMDKVSNYSETFLFDMASEAI